MLDRNRLQAYELIRQQHLETLNAEGYLLRHRKTGARVALISNDDDNKVFQIGFRTTPKDNTGVPHIIEHTVLCGSKKYPVKDPFVELAKGSLNTFLNAITFPDKTLYPVASCNDRDFQNLMDVYLDAVFHPNIYQVKEIFQQEGWHYEMESEEDPLRINGVVYNEMKGAYSSPEELVFNLMNEALFPDNCYGKDSGGDPAAIPTLTREAYLAFHRAYYHPSNSFIYLYGDMDMEEKLRYIDEEYLSSFEFCAIDSEIPMQKALEKPVEREASYSVASGEGEENKTILAYGAVVKDALDRELYIAMDVLNYALMQSPGAPLKQALLDNGVGNDISGVWMSGIRQPFYMIEAKNANMEDFEKFKKIIHETLLSQVEKGLDRKVLEAGLNTLEFKYREADFGSDPKGLIYGFMSMDSWLYDENEPFLHVEALDTFRTLRQKMETSYYEDMIRTYLIKNSHSAYIVLKPEQGLSGREDARLAAELAEKKASMSRDEIARIVADTKRLKEYQEESSTEQQLKTLPMLARSDIRKEPLEINNTVYKQDEITVLHHEMFTGGIHYLHLMFDVGQLPAELLPCLGVLRSVWGLLDTKEYSYAQLSNEIDRTTGGIGCSLSFYEKVKNPEQFELRFTVSSKTLYGKLPKAMELIVEIIENTRFDGEKRLRELIAETRSRMQDDISSSGNRYGLLRAESYHSEMGYMKDMVKGIGFYQYLSDLDDHFEERKDELIRNLKKLNELVFRKENLLVSSTCTKEEFCALEPRIKEFSCHLSSSEGSCTPCKLLPESKNEGFMDASQVQYVCQSGNFRKAGYEYTGVMNMLHIILSFDYLWQNIRVKGGAYGCSGSMIKNGNVSLCTYRDPNLEKTLEVFAQIPEYLEHFDVDEWEMTKYVIGTFGLMDTPLTPAAKGIRSASHYLRGITMEDLRKERLQIINATPEDIRALAEPMRAALSQNHICVVGNEEKIRSAKDIFYSICTIN
ncbi:MAG: insulinase family protein [Lachnospiraceae bacterium]